MPKSKSVEQSEQIVRLETNQANYEKVFERFAEEINIRFDKSDIVANEIKKELRQFSDSIMKRLEEINNATSTRISKLEFADNLIQKDQVEIRSQVKSIMQSLESLKVLENEVAVIKRYWKPFVIGGIVTVTAEIILIIMIFLNITEKV